LQLVGVEIIYEGAEHNLGAKNGKNYTQIIVVNRSVDASYQVLVHCPKWFQRRSFFAEIQLFIQSLSFKHFIKIVHAPYKHFGDLVTCDKLIVACPNRN
jgi:hypothetical protein